jgi:hypothetical protein
MQMPIFQAFKPYSAALAAIRDRHRIPGMSIALDAVASVKAKPPQPVAFVPPFREKQQ